MWKRFRTWQAQRHVEQNPFKAHELVLANQQQVVFVRKAQIEDAAAMVALEKKSFAGKMPWDKSAFTREIRRDRQTLYVIVELKQRPIAYCGCWLINQEAHITNIAVDPEFRRSGIAYYLLRQMIGLAESKACQKMTLEVRSDNKGAQTLYRKLGFTTTGVQPNYYVEDNEDALHMTLELEDRQ